MRKKFLIATKDAGGYAGCLRGLIQSLRIRNHTVHIVTPVRSVAGDLLDKEGASFLRSDNPNAVLCRFGKPDVLIVSEDSGKAIGQELVPFMRAMGVPTFLIEDYWAPRLKKEWKDFIYRPDYILVNDKIAKKLVREAWSDYQPSRILETGFLSLDRWANVDIPKQYRMVRDGLHLDPLLPLVFFSGQGYHTAAAIRELNTALLDIRADCFVLVRLHPRMVSGEMFQEELPHCLDAIQTFTAGRLIKDTSSIETPSLVAACAVNGVVVSMFSHTIAIDAAACRAPAISIWYPRIGQAAFREELGLEDFVPEKLRTVAIAKTRGRLRMYLHNALHGVLHLRKSQERYFKVDGRNTERSIEAILARC